MSKLSQRFRKFLPVVIDVETGGFDLHTDGLLEVACVFLNYQESKLVPTSEKHYHILPFEGANLDPEALEFNGIDPFHPFRFAVSEADALNDLYAEITAQLKETGCQKAVLVGHNAWFDLSFIKAASDRAKIKMPLHSFTSFDTATLGAVFYKHTVLAKVLEKANINYDHTKAHSALYDAQITSELFCKIVNNYEI